MDEAEHALVRADAEPLQHDGVIGWPAGEPLCAKAFALRCHQQRQAGGAAREQLFDFRHLVPGRQPGDDCDDQRGMLEAHAVLFDTGLGGAGMAFDAATGQQFSQARPGGATDQQEAPWLQFAVVGDVDRTGQDSQQLACVGAGPGKQAGGNRVAVKEWVQRMHAPHFSIRFPTAWANCKLNHIMNGSNAILWQLPKL